MSRPRGRAAAAVVAAALTLALTLAGPAVPALAAPGPPQAPEYWFDTWNVPQLWSSGVRGQGITIAEIDSGVNASLPELAGRVLAGKDFGHLGGDGRTDRTRDRFGHGTAMASLMVARPGSFGISGLAPDAKVLPVTIPLRGTSEANDGDYLPDAIRYAADHGAKIISMSLGGAAESGPNTLACTDEEQGAILHALAKGDLLIAAGGNDGVHAHAEEPGVCLGVVSVAASDDSDHVASFSSRHPYTALAAPGVDIPTLSRVPGTAFAGDGTSQATAITSAVAALVWSRYPSLTARQVLTRVLATLAHHRSTRDPAYGYGILDANAAVNDRVSPQAPNPVFDAAAPYLRAAEQRQPAPASVAPVSRASSPPGQLAIDSPPGPEHRRADGVGTAVVGGVAFLVLVAYGIARRRRARGRRSGGWLVAPDHPVAGTDDRPQ